MALHENIPQTVGVLGLGIRIIVLAPYTSLHVISIPYWTLNPGVEILSYGSLAPYDLVPTEMAPWLLGGVIPYVAGGRLRRCGGNR